MLTSEESQGEAPLFSLLLVPVFILDHGSRLLVRTGNTPVFPQWYLTQVQGVQDYLSMMLTSVSKCFVWN